MSSTNEWNLLKSQFDELARDACADSIELDADFHRRFAELMNQFAVPRSTTRMPTRSRKVPKSECIKGSFIDPVRFRSKNEELIMRREDEYRQLAKCVRKRAGDEESAVMRAQWEILAGTYVRLADQSAKTGQPKRTDDTGTYGDLNF